MNHTGVIFQLNVSSGGVPKTAVRRVDVNHRGIQTDKQADKVHHGSPEQALCLYSLERIQALQAEGHPIFPGAAGENITVSGLDWDQIIPGIHILLNQEVLVEITGYATPCQKIRKSFAKEAFGRLSETKYPGWARVYARVLHPGSLITGAAVEILHAPRGA